MINKIISAVLATAIIFFANIDNSAKDPVAKCGFYFLIFMGTQIAVSACFSQNENPVGILNADVMTDIL